MSNKRPLNLTLQPEIVDWAKKIMAERHYSSMSVLVEELIRDRYDQLFGASDERPKSSNSTSASARPGNAAAKERPMKKPKAA